MTVAAISASSQFDERARLDCQDGGSRRLEFLRVFNTIAHSQ